MTPAIIALLIIDAILVLALIIYFIVSKVKSPKTATVEDSVIEQEPVATVEVVPEEKKVTVPDGLGDDRELAKRLTFAQKMLELDKKTQEYYDAVNNAFKALRKINARVSSKGVSYRLGKELVAKVTVRGKTMKLHLALDVNAFPVNVYFQNDLSSVKTYKDVPFTVKVKSDRGLKNALKLIEALAKDKSIESKVRYTKIDSLEALKELI